MNRPSPCAPTARQPARQRGFTLVEVIVSAGLLGFLAIAATYFWVDNFTLVRMVYNDSAAIAEGRAALERLAREIREVKFNVTSGAYCINTMTATQMVFYKTSGTYVATCSTNANPNSNNHDFYVNVQLSGTDLRLQYAGTSATPVSNSVLTGYVSSLPNSFSMRYLDKDFNVTTSKSALRFVELTLTLGPTGTQATKARTLVALRNN